MMDGGLIQIEVCRKKGKPCHNGSIQQILLHESDIFTVGEDGYIRVWDFETIDTAEAVEEGGKMEIEPLNELKVGTDSKLMGITHGADNDMALWFAQDANGNVWKLDLSFSKNSLDPEIVQSFMSGAITGLDVSTSYDIFAASAGNSVRIMHTFTQDVLAQRIFNKKTTSLKWIPSAVDEKSDGIFLGFEDGVVRFVRLRSVTNKSEKKLDFDIRLSQVIKPHTKSVTCIALEVSNRWVATGSADGTVFFFNFSPKGLTPIGFVNTKNAVTYMTWTPSHYAKPRLMVCLNNGTVLEYDAPTGRYDATTSYSIESQLAVRIFKFRSIKSKLRHEEELERKRKEEEERQKKLEEERRLRGIEKKDKATYTDLTILISVYSTATATADVVIVFTF
ncbi:unnamed protein product [Didymodactylos carnosus]|uniref:Uncharacterized protein n=1 Tax=Didymodactylos carnosus TaxID=1234261 RepID=A0A814MN38_9BILA|nr:unnamed protein product [Didymodactylos carnosus]CAF1189840.1 unnamed protein product [Didymodactylos carnosus]CAF3847292.1 unnamed protein product [Didymodactylos carnosus]CAF4000885.1 unnamed protein product [Didymodactylos carnosus]